MVNEQLLRLSDYLTHILQAVEEVQDYVVGMSFEEFRQDKKTQRAVLMCFIIIGEASTKIVQKYPNFTKDNSQVAWHAMKGMRNQLAHGYFSINLQIVWNTIEQALPTLKNQLKEINLD